MSDIRFNQWLHQSGTGGVSQVASGAVGVGTTNPLADFYVRGDAQITGILTAGHIAMGSSITFGDNDRIYLGDGTDFQLYHNSADNNSYIVESGAGSLVVNASTLHVKNAANNEDVAKFTQSGNNELYFSNSKKFETTNTGVVITGICTATSFKGDGSALTGITGTTINNNANNRVITGSGTANTLEGEANLTFDGTALTFANVTGPGGSESRIYAHTEGGATTGTLVLEGKQDLRLKTGGFNRWILDGGDLVTHGTTYNNLGSSSTSGGRVGNVNVQSSVDLIDNAEIRIGTSDDLKLYHNGSNSYISNSGVGNLMITGNNSDKIHIRAHASKQEIICFPGGAVQLFHNDSLRFETTSSGATISGQARVSSTNESADGAFDDLIIGNHSGNRGISILSGSSSQGALGFAKSGTLADGYVAYNHNSTATSSSMVLKSSGKIQFNAGSSEKVHIASGGGILIGSGNQTKTQDGVLIERNSSDGYAHIVAGRSGGNYSGFNFYVAGASGVTLRHLIDYQSNFRWYAADGTTERLHISNNGLVKIPTATSTNNTELLRLENTHSDGKMSVLGFRTNGLSGPQTKIYGGNDNTGAGSQSGASGAGKFKVTITNPSGTAQEVIYAENDSSSKFTRISAGGGEAARFFSSTNGRLRVAMNNYAAGPSTSNYGIEFANTNAASHWSATGTSTANHIIWLNPNGTCGSIQTSGSNTSYNTSSDYRLKENVSSISDAITRVKNLSPIRFNWISDSTNTLQDGFLAHEVAPIVPEAVSGTKDAVELEDTDYGTKGDIIPQQLDTSRLVPLLTAALQEAIAEIETLKTEVAALKAA